jgi:hypothetical protein
LECRVKFAAILGTTDENSPSTHVDFLAGRRGWALLAGRSRPSRNEPCRGSRRVRYRVANPALGHHLPGECLVRPYFATYPLALNPKGEPSFRAADDAPWVNGLGTLVDGQPEGVLLTHNPNAINAANGTDAINPFRLARSQAPTL